MKKKVVPNLRPEVKVKVDIVTSDDVKIDYTGKFQDFTARYIIKMNYWYNSNDGIRLLKSKKQRLKRKNKKWCWPIFSSFFYDPPPQLLFIFFS